MAVVNSNNMFDWCDDIARAKTNYSDKECLNIFKNHVSNLAGVDRNFAKRLNETNENGVRFVNTYVPVYMLKIRATYTYDVTQTKDDIVTTTTYNETYTFDDFATAGYNNAIQAQIFVGRNDDRWYELSHVDDLPFCLFNNQCAYSYNEMQSKVEYLAKYKHTGTCFVNGFTATAVFVPVVNIYYSYNGYEYFCLINKHNGKITFQAPVSAEGKQKAQKAALISRVCKIIWITSFALSLLTAVISVFARDILIGLFMLAFTGVTQGVLLYFGKEKEILTKDYKHYEWLFKNNGKITLKNYIADFIFTFLSVVIFIVSVIMVLTP